jgi:regulatory protein
MVSSSRITRIVKVQGEQRYRIELDGEEWFSVHEDVLVQFALRKGMEVNAEQIRAWITAEEIGKAKRAALRFLTHRPRTAKEVFEHLLQKGFERETAEAVLEEMVRFGYVDDRRFAKAWTEARRGGKGYGTGRIRRELLAKGISPEWINEALEQVEEDEERRLAMEVAERRYFRMKGESWQNVERKLGSFLLRRGFSMDVVLDVLRKFREGHGKEGGEA